MQQGHFALYNRQLA